MILYYGYTVFSFYTSKQSRMISIFRYKTSVETNVNIYLFFTRYFFKQQFNTSDHSDIQLINTLIWRRPILLGEVTKVSSPYVRH